MQKQFNQSLKSKTNQNKTSFKKKIKKEFLNQTNDRGGVQGYEGEAI